MFKFYDKKGETWTTDLFVNQTESTSFSRQAETLCFVCILSCLSFIEISDSQNFALVVDAEMEKNSQLYSSLLAGLGVVVGVATLCQNYFLAKAGENLTMRLRQMAFAAMLRQDIGWFDDKSNQVGALTSRLATDASLVKGVSNVYLGTENPQYFIFAIYANYG